MNKLVRTIFFVSLAVWLAAPGFVMAQRTTPSPSTPLRAVPSVKLQCVPVQARALSPSAPLVASKPRNVGGWRGALIQMLQGWRAAIMADVRQQLQEVQKSGC